MPGCIDLKEGTYPAYTVRTGSVKADTLRTTTEAESWGVITRLTDTHLRRC
jgi:hypothetical protein